MSQPRFVPLSLLQAILRGAGQILFQPSALTGAALLLLVLCGSPQAFILCLAGLTGATACGYWLAPASAATRDGVEGFNGALFGLALWAIYDFSAVLPAIALLGGAATGLVRFVWGRWIPLPPFTAPYVLVMWCLQALGQHLLSPAAGPVAASAGSGLQVLVTNAAQVLFVSDPWIGALVVVSVLLHSVSAAVWILAASLVAMLTALLPWGVSAELMLGGMLGYNAIILAAALEARRTQIPLALAGFAASVALSVLFIGLPFAMLSAPFVLTAWAIIGCERWLPRILPARQTD